MPQSGSLCSRSLELWCHPSRRQAPKRNRNFASCIMPKQTSEPSSGSQCPFPPPQPRARHVLDQSEMDTRSTGAHPAKYHTSARLPCWHCSVRTASTRGAETHTRQIRSAVLGQTHYRALIYAHRTHPLLSSQPLWCDPFSVRLYSYPGPSPLSGLLCRTVPIWRRTAKSPGIPRDSSA